MTKKFIRILLVEDNEGDVRLTREALRESQIQHQLYVVENGVEALEFLNSKRGMSKEGRPDIILLDLNLPEKDGREVLQEIKVDQDLRRIPVIVLTTSNDEQDILTSYDLHANCYISKPIDIRTFQSVVQQIEQFWFSIVRLPSHNFM
ncbi:MAG: response regulator [Chloroflexota bacterium]|nr:response regulator [Chloroflexota bacterium]